jgi:hypothetical protein
MVATWEKEKVGAKKLVFGEKNHVVQVCTWIRIAGPSGAPQNIRAVLLTNCGEFSGNWGYAS